MEHLRFQVGFHTNRKLDSETHLCGQCRDALGGWVMGSGSEKVKEWDGFLKLDSDGPALMQLLLHLRTCSPAPLRADTPPPPY